MEFFVARQPIFDKKQNVYAYELLYRVSTENNYYESDDGDRATSEVVANSFLLIGIEALTGGKRAFINFTQNLLKNEVPAILPQKLIAVEILEDVESSEEIISCCKKLKKMGYMLVLDDFVCNKSCEPFLDVVDIVKVDFLNTPFDKREKIVKRCSKLNVKLLAEKVETREDFEHALKLGYSLFQGYFFSKPVILSGRDLPAYKLNYLHVLKEVSAIKPDLDKIENFIRQDVSLSYKLLKYINSAAYGFVNRIKSIRHALTLLGISEIKKWISLVTLTAIAEDKPGELVKLSVARARFCELLAPKSHMDDMASEMFLMGLFSAIDALIDKPLAEIIDDLPIWTDIKEALLGKQGRCRDLLDLIISYEKGDWDCFIELAEKMNLDMAEIPDIFLQAIKWADEIYK